MRRIARIVLIIGVVNFVAFAIGTFILGGDAVNGQSRCPGSPGKFYLFAKQLPNPCHEVSRTVYLYSEIHCWSLLLTWPFVMFAGFYEWHRRKLSFTAPDVTKGPAGTERRVRWQAAMLFGVGVFYLIACVVVFLRSVFR